ncbi:MAG: FAD-dependent thymidylate synthase [Oscillospiraceae bacterium]
MKVTLIAHTPEPEKTVAAAAKLCYSASGVEDLLDNLTPEKTTSFVEMLSDIGHESPIEHASFTFGIEGVSRSFLAQITRHRLASFSVQSQRYVKNKNFTFITPPEIEKDEKAREIFLKSMDDAIKAYNDIADILESKYYAEYISDGLSEKSAKTKAEKKAIEDARFVLPNAAETKMVVTMNARSLHNFFRLRCCNRAQWEIKAVADEMLRLCCEVAPTLFKNAGPSCASGVCSEGKMSCKKANEMKEYYKELKNGKANSN